MLFLILLATGLTVAPRPPEPGLLRDVVWPVLAATPRGEAGLLWASEPSPGIVRLHRVLFAGEREITTDVALPPGESEAAISEVLRLRLSWLLEAPPDTGTPRTTPDLPPPPPPPLLPPERADDLRTQRPALPPRRRTTVPTPPGVGLEAPGNQRSVQAGELSPEEASGRLRLRVGGEVLADLDTASPGFALAGVLLLSEGWRLGGVLSAHPFHDFRRENQVLGATHLGSMLRVGRTLWRNEWVGLIANGGVFHASLWGVGRGITTSGGRLGAALGGALDVTLGGPLSVALEADVLASPWTSEARYGSDVLLRRGPVELRTAVLIGWVLW